MMKPRTFKGLFLTIMLTGLLSLAGNLLAGDKSSGKTALSAKSCEQNQAVVSVNGDKLVKKDLDKLMQRQVNLLKLRRVPDYHINQNRAMLKKMVINDFINRSLIKQEAKKENITVTDKEVTAAIENMKKDVPKGITFDMVLKANGFTRKTIKDETRLRLMAQKLLKKDVDTGPAPSKTAIEKYYTENKASFKVPEMVHVRHILIKTDKNADKKTMERLKKRAVEVREKLLKGADFAEMAKKYSDCPSKQNGGDLGTFRRGVMVKPFEKAAFSQKVNEIGPVIKTRFGYHIIQVLEHKKAHTSSLNEVKDKIKNKLESDQKLKAWITYLDGLKKEAKIVYAKGYEPDTKNQKGITK